MNDSTLVTWSCTAPRCTKIRSAPCDPHSCAGHLIDARDFKTQAHKMNTTEAEWK